MHEVSLVARLVERIEEVARLEGFDRVLELRVEVGSLSGVEPACVEFCFAEVARGTVLEGACLVLEFVEAEILCHGCGRASRPEDPAVLICPGCGAAEVQVRKGRDFQIVDLEVV